MEQSLVVYGDVSILECLGAGLDQGQIVVKHLIKKTKVFSRLEEFKHDRIQQGDACILFNQDCHLFFRGGLCMELWGQRWGRISLTPHAMVSHGMLRSWFILKQAVYFL